MLAGKDSAVKNIFSLRRAFQRRVERSPVRSPRLAMACFRLGWIAVLLCGWFPAVGQPATNWVTTTADEGPGSLRQAILDANAEPTPAYIHLNITPKTIIQRISTAKITPTVIAFFFTLSIS